MRAIFRSFRTALMVAVPVVLVTNAATGEKRCADPTVLLVVRHADRAGTDDALSAAGVERARDLARVAAASGVTAIYHSDTARTRLTAEPLAVTLGITPVELPGKDIDGLLKHVLAHHCGETVLIVGHSNTVPLIVGAAGGPAMPDLPEHQFDDLFIVTTTGAAAKVVRLKYGAPTP
jgi:broad specificity phosphatase PhoE